VQAIQNGQFKGDTINIQRVFTDSNVVVMHSRLQIDTSKAWIQFDVFRFENGRIVEHWNNRALEVNDMDKTIKVINTSFSGASHKKINKRIIEVNIEKQLVPNLNRILVQEGVEIHAMEPKRKLEDFFMKIIQS
jgi:hypothetical protein